MVSQPTGLPNLREHLADRRALERGITDLRAAGKYAETVTLAERYAEVVETELGAKALEVAIALIDLTELLIAVDRSVEAEPLLKRAFEIIVQAPYGEAALRERFSHIDANKLVHAVPALRDLIGYTHELRYERELRKRQCSRGNLMPPGTSALKRRRRPSLDYNEIDANERWHHKRRCRLKQGASPIKSLSACGWGFKRRPRYASGR